MTRGGTLGGVVVVAVLAALIFGDRDTSVPSIQQPAARPTTTVAQATTSPSLEYLYVTGSSVNVRSGPSTDFAVLTSLSRDTRVQVVGTSVGWAEVILPTGTVGWMTTQFLSTTAPRVRTLVQPAGPSDTEIARILIRQSQQGYSGNCPCPDNYDAAGRRCGGRSAYSRAGGASSLCYISDVSAAMIAAYRRTQ